MNWEGKLKSDWQFIAEAFWFLVNFNYTQVLQGFNLLVQE